MRNALRGKLIASQDERNRRLERAPKKERRAIKETAKSVFVCHPCKREVFISWSELGSDTPQCIDCGGILRLSAAIVNKGVLPRLQQPTNRS